MFFIFAYFSSKVFRGFDLLTIAASCTLFMKTKLLSSTFCHLAYLFYLDRELFLFTVSTVIAEDFYTLYFSLPLKTKSWHVICMNCFQNLLLNMTVCWAAVTGRVLIPLPIAGTNCGGSRRGVMGHTGVKLFPLCCKKRRILWHSYCHDWVSGK